MIECEICKKECKNVLGLCTHINKEHNITYLKYLIEYEKFQIPKCKICNNNAKHKSGKNFYVTCCNLECIGKQISKFSKNRKHSNETKEKLRKKRLDYMKNNPEKT